MLRAEGGHWERIAILFSVVQRANAQGGPLAMGLGRRLLICKARATGGVLVVAGWFIQRASQLDYLAH